MWMSSLLVCYCVEVVSRHGPYFVPQALPLSTPRVSQVLSGSLELDLPEPVQVVFGGPLGRGERAAPLRALPPNHTRQLFVP